MEAEKPKPKRLFQVWRGSNLFFFGGRLIFGPNIAPLFLSTFLIAGPAVAFSTKILCLIRHRIKQDKDVASWYPLLIVAVLLTILDVFLLWLTSSRDPGIIPRNAKPPELDETFEIDTPSMEWIDGTTPHLKLSKTEDVLVNGYTIKVKFCDTCLLYRPPRTSHCYICNNCVQRFDHHCPWIGQCIGIRNYRLFYMFISTSTILCIYVFVVSWINIVQAKGLSLKAMSSDVLSAVLIVYCFVVSWFIGGLTVFHFYLMSTNQTTHENFRCHYRDKGNPYNKGIIKNIKEILFSKIPPSMNDFRSLVQEDEVTVKEHSAPTLLPNITSSKENTDSEKGAMYCEDNEAMVPEMLPGLQNGDAKNNRRQREGDETPDSGLFFFSVEQELVESISSSAIEIEVIMNSTD